LGVSIPSEEEYTAQNTDRKEYSLFPADDYILEVAQVTEQPGKVDIFDKPKEGQPQRTYTGLEVRLRPISFANGDELQDEDGEDIPEDRNPLIFDWFDPSKVGLKPQPAKARKFFAASMGVELEDRIDVDDFNDLIGKRVIGTVIIKPGASGNRNNRVTSYRKVRVRRGAAAAPAKATDAAATAAAKIAPAGPLPNQVESPFTGDDEDLPF
jgi:hypothetical protein